MNKKLFLLLVLVFDLVLFLFIKSVNYPLENVRQKQSESLFVGQGACSTPAQVQNVLVSYPSCVGDTCDFTKGGCSWSSTVGASKYQVKVTSVETNAVVKDEQVDSSVTSATFPVAQSNTYKCDVSAINACGTSGTAGSHSLFCKVDAVVGASPTPVPVQNNCGFSCTADSECKTGFVCAKGASGSGFCALPSQLSACSSTPSVSNCCSKPTIPPAGNATTTIAASLGALIFVVLGIAIFLW